MRRAVPVLIVVLAAAAAIVWFMGGPAEQPPGALESPAVAAVEARLRESDVDGARAALEAAGPGLAAVPRDFLEGLILLAEAKYFEAQRPLRRAWQADPAEWRPLDAYTAVLFALGQHGEAQRVLADALRERPEDERILALAARAHLVGPAPDPRLALEHLDHVERLAERLPPDDPTAVHEADLLVLRHGAETTLGRHRSALAVARLLTERHPEAAAFHVLRAESARMLGLLPEAADEYSVATRLAPEQRVWCEHLVQLLLQIPGREADLLARSSALLAKWPEERSVTVLRARALLRCDELVPDAYERAVSIYRDLLEKDPDDLEVLRNLAVILYDWKQAGQPGEYLIEAHRLLLRYVRGGGEIDARLADTWQQLQRVARERSQPDAVAELRAAWEAAPGDVALTARYYDALEAAGHAEETGGVVRRALEAAGDDLAVRLLAAVHFLDGPEADRDAAEVLLQLDAADELAGGRHAERRTWLRYRALARLDRWDTALRLAAELAGRRPQTAIYQRALGRAARRTGYLAEAEAAYRQALALRPGDVDWQAELLEVLLDLEGREAQTLARAEELLAAHPGHRRLRLVRARALGADPQRRGEALDAYRALLVKSPADAEVLALAALAYDAAGNEAEARRLLAAFEATGSEPTGELAELRERLRPSR